MPSTWWRIVALPLLILLLLLNNRAFAMDAEDDSTSSERIVRQTYDNPAVNSFSIDRCVNSLGEVSCDTSANAKVSLAFCKQQGAENWVSNRSRCEAGRYDTYRLTERVERGQIFSAWTYCPGCTCRISQVVCSFSVR